MKSIEVVDRMKLLASMYRKDAAKSIERNRHMNSIEEGEIVQQRHIDALLVDYINYSAALVGIDYALYTEDLK